jgi:hypothetical protein
MSQAVASLALLFSHDSVKESTQIQQCCRVLQDQMDALGQLDTSALLVGDNELFTELASQLAGGGDVGPIVDRLETAANVAHIDAERAIDTSASDAQVASQLSAQKRASDRERVLDAAVSMGRAAELAAPFREQVGGPGAWKMELNAARNMSDRARAYQEQVAGHDATEGYYVRGVQFDGFKAGVLLDAKHLADDGRFARAYNSLTQGEQGDYVHALDRGSSLLAEAKRQVNAAKGASIEWHVAGRVAADAIETLFKAHELLWRPGAPSGLIRVICEKG